MTSRKKRRITLLGLGLMALAGATALVLTAFNDHITFFYGPSEVYANQVPEDRYFRMGGLVAEGSFKEVGDATVTFEVTDGANAVPVRYRGLLPDLFREGQGVVTQGRMNGEGVFIAEEVLARHDENYMPSEVSEALKRGGQWKGEGIENGAVDSSY